MVSLWVGKIFLRRLFHCLIGWALWHLVSATKARPQQFVVIAIPIKKTESVSLVALLWSECLLINALRSGNEVNMFQASYWHANWGHNSSSQFFGCPGLKLKAFTVSRSFPHPFLSVCNMMTFRVLLCVFSVSVHSALSSDGSDASRVGFGQLDNPSACGEISNGGQCIGVELDEHALLQLQNRHGLTTNKDSPKGFRRFRSFRRYRRHYHPYPRKTTTTPTTTTDTLPKCGSDQTVANASAVGIFIGPPSGSDPTNTSILFDVNLGCSLSSGGTVLLDLGQQPGSVDVQFVVVSSIVDDFLRMFLTDSGGVLAAGGNVTNSVSGSLITYSTTFVFPNGPIVDGPFPFVLIIETSVRAEVTDASGSPPELVFIVDQTTTEEPESTEEESPWDRIFTGFLCDARTELLECFIGKKKMSQFFGCSSILSYLGDQELAQSDPFHRQQLQSAILWSSSTCCTWHSKILWVQAVEWKPSRCTIN